MAKLVMTNANVTLGGTDISAYVASVTLSISVNEVETTSFGVGAVQRVGGLQDNSVTLDLHQDYSAIEGLVYPLIGSTTSLVVKPNGTAVGTANPSYTTNSVLITEWTPVNGAVGELATISVTWPISGTVTKAVA
jgi:hypothetical protein